MRLCVITLTYNEETILQFFLRHYERFADQIVVIDSMSSDRTREIVAGSKIAELRDRKATQGVIDDGANVALKNTVYRSINADWFIVVDADEFVYHPDLRLLLDACDARGYNLVQCEGWNMIGDAIPADGLLTEQMRLGVRDDYTVKYFDKAVIFKRGIDIRFEPGCHSYQATNAQPAPGQPVKLLHYKWLSREYVERKAANLKLSQNNVLSRLGFMADGRPNNATWVEYYLAAREKRVRAL